MVKIGLYLSVQKTDEKLQTYRTIFNLKRVNQSKSRNRIFNPWQDFPCWESKEANL